MKKTPMKRSGFRRKDGPTPRPAREWTGEWTGEYRSEKPRARIEPCDGKVRAVPKDDLLRSEKLMRSAKGEDCLVRIPGCPSDPEMTIWSHYRGSAGGKGRGIKSTEIAGAYACTYCDAVYDGQRPRPAGMSKEDVDLAWLEGHIRSLVRLGAKGLVKV
jgi:hypothetical protein